MTTDLRTEILQLEKILLEKKHMLFLTRLKKIAKCELQDHNVNDVTISVDPLEETWQITYRHKTTKFSQKHYYYNDSSESDEETNDSSNYTKETKVSFGKSDKYFIRGGIKIKVYRNASGELRVINPEYEFDLDLDEQRKLITEYSENYDVPEWFAITVFLFLSDNRWDDKAIINHLSIV